MRISVDDSNVKSLEELTGKNLSKNGNEIIAEVIEMAEAGNKPNSPCWMESDCSETEEVEAS